MFKKRILLWLCAVFGVWGLFLIFFSTIYPIASNVREMADQKMEMNHATYLPIKQIPLSFQQAVIAAEDRRFYEHFGIDLIGVARSLFVDIQSNQFSEGGSTITQQLIRNTVLSTEKTLKRKIEEAILAVALERFMSKQEILELYLNDIYYGHGAYGAEQAAQIYFGKPIGSLNLAEWAMLAGLPNSPSELDPYKNMDQAKKRQGEVLASMVETNQISQQQEKEALKYPILLVGN